MMRVRSCSEFGTKILPPADAQRPDSSLTRVRVSVSVSEDCACKMVSVVGQSVSSAGSTKSRTALEVAVSGTGPPAPVLGGAGDCVVEAEAERMPEAVVLPVCERVRGIDGLVEIEAEAEAETGTKPEPEPMDEPRNTPVLECTGTPIGERAMRARASVVCTVTPSGRRVEE